MAPVSPLLVDSVVKLLGDAFYNTTTTSISESPVTPRVIHGMVKHFHVLDEDTDNTLNRFPRIQYINYKKLYEVHRMWSKRAKVGKEKQNHIKILYCYSE